MRILIALMMCALTMPAWAARPNPESWSIDVRGGVFQPTGSAMKRFFGGVSPHVAMSGGYLHDSKYGVDFGASYFKRSGTALGVSSGSSSQDRFSLWMIPMELEGTVRFDFKPEQMLVPYVKAGADLIYYRENDTGSTIQGIKYGVHGGGGLGLLLNQWVDGGVGDAYAINDVYFIVDGRYRWVDNFGGSGLDLSGWSASGGLHIQF